MNKQSQHPILVRNPDHDPENPFAGDLFARRELATRLTGLIDRLHEGCVFAINAPWGEGKTWFAKNWQTELLAQGFDTVLIDAFKHDYVDDPFVMLCSEVLSKIDNKDGAKEKVTAAGRLVARALLPAAAKALVNLGGRVLLGSADIAEDLKKAGEEFDKGLGDVVQKGLARRLDDFEADRRSVDAFAATLREHSENRDKPLVVLLDELDRCRPDFAIKTVERIKHFFDTPGIVFVLLVNRPQIEAYVRGIYGDGVDATTYLGKFVQFWISLPKTASLEAGQQDFNQIYCGDLARRFGLNSRDGHEGFRIAFSTLATLTGLSLRDLERGYTLFSLAQPLDNSGILAAWAVYLKLARPEIHAGIVAGRNSAHSEARKILLRLIPASKEFWSFPILEEIHRAHEDGFNAPFSTDVQGVMNSIGFRGSKIHTFLPWLFGRVDLNVQT